MPQAFFQLEREEETEVIKLDVYAEGAPRAVCFFCASRTVLGLPLYPPRRDESSRKGESVLRG